MAQADQVLRRQPPPRRLRLAPARALAHLVAQRLHVAGEREVVARARLHQRHREPVVGTRAGGIPDLAITIPGGRSLDQATNDDFRAHYIGIQGQNIEDETKGARLDATYELGGVFKSISLGGAWTDREKTVATIDNQYTTSCNYCGYPFTFGQLGADVVRPGSRNGILGINIGKNKDTPNERAIDDYLAGVVAIDVGSSDLQQSSDVIVRLHAEYLWSRGERDKISYLSATKLSMPLSR